MFSVGKAADGDGGVNVDGVDVDDTGVVDAGLDDSRVGAALDSLYASDAASSLDSLSTSSWAGGNSADEMDDGGPDTEASLDVLQSIPFGQMVGQSEPDYGVIDSHTLVELDAATGEPFSELFVYVNERSCIGCTHCAHVAPSTFFMEEEHGRARAYRQEEDDPAGLVAEAVDCCPVNCIHFVPWNDLKRLEAQRRGQLINNKARLVNPEESRMSSQGQFLSSLSPPVEPDLDNLREKRARREKSRAAESREIEGDRSFEL